MAGKRSISTSEFVNDIRAGLADAELMEKYQLSYNALQRAFKQLLESKTITKGELYGRASLHPATEAIPVVDHSARHYLVFPLPIYEPTRPNVIGRVRDITERDLGIIGIEAELDDVKTLVIFPEKFLNFEPFRFDAICEWSRRDNSGECVAGFTITRISEESQRRLTKLVISLTLGESRRR
jgi:hypothetical protein